MVSEYDKVAILIAVPLVAFIILTVVYIVPLAIESQAAKDECKNKAHELGFRHLDYIQKFNECWAERPDGSIVDLFKEGNNV